MVDLTTALIFTVFMMTLAILATYLVVTALEHHESPMLIQNINSGDIHTVYGTKIVYGNNIFLIYDQSGKEPRWSWTNANEWLPYDKHINRRKKA